ncbi:Hypothetical predicted protein [Octopus vulgaris]|uniref:Uncharacterized protein n=1 Tax=Octopus vulgaris TaxID=6645 RepID=A0AA36F1A1_OCTVU|nr:Hypothetical predicted protein [Octopus vulgaris]
MDISIVLLFIKSYTDFVFVQNTDEDDDDSKEEGNEDVDDIDVAYDNECRDICEIYYHRYEVTYIVPYPDNV